MDLTGDDGSLKKALAKSGQLGATENLARGLFKVVKTE